MYLVYLIQLIIYKSITNNVLYKIGRSEIKINENTDNPYIPESQFYMPVGDDLEKTAWAVSKDLPVILIGETGVGKTLLVRHLAQMTNNGFRRVNLNGNLCNWRYSRMF